MFFTCFSDDYDLSLFFLNRSSKTNYRMAHSSLFSCTFSVCKEGGVRLVNSVFNSPDGPLMFFELFKLNRRTVKSILLVKNLLGLVQMTSGLVNASFYLQLALMASCKNYFLCTLLFKNKLMEIDFIQLVHKAKLTHYVHF